MRTALLTLVLALWLAPPAAACGTPPTEPGIVLTVCRGSVTLSGPGTVSGNVYRDADPTRLPEVRITGDGGEGRLHVGRLDREGILMESAIGADRLPAEPHDLTLTFDFALLELDAADVADAPTDARRVFGSPRTPLSEPAAARVSAACFGFRATVPAPFIGPVGTEFVLRTLRATRRGRARLTQRLAAAPATSLDRRYLAPLLASLRRGDRHLLAARRRWRAGQDGVGRMVRAYERLLPREGRLRRRLGLAECEAGYQPFAAAATRR